MLTTAAREVPETSLRGQGGEGRAVKGEVSGSKDRREYNQGRVRRQ